MAEEINLVVNVEGGDGKRTVKEVRDELKAAEDQAGKTGKGLSDGIGQAEVKTKSLKAQLREMKAQLLSLDEGSAEFQKMATRAAQLEDRIGDVSARVKALASDTKRIDALVGVGTGIAAGFQAASGAMALFGSDSKKVEKAIQNVIAVQGILNGVQTVAQLLQKEHIVGIYARIAAEAIFGKAIVATTGAQKTLNTVMKANPLGLLITAIAALATGIGLLIANIDAVVGWFKEMGRVLFGIGEAEYQLEKSRRENAQASAARNTQTLKELNDERAERRKNFQDEQEALDLEISALEAVGKSSYALRLQKAQNRLEDLKGELEHIEKVSASWRQYYVEQFVSSGKSREDFIKTLKGQGIDIESLTAQRDELQKEVQTAITKSEIEISKIKYDEGVKQNAASKQASDERLKIAQAEADALKRALEEKAQAEKEADELFNQRMQEQFDAEFDAMEAQIDLENQQKEDADAFDAELRQKKLDDQKRFADATIQSAQATLNSLESLNSLFFGKDIERIKKKIAAGEQLTDKEEKQRKRQNAINKAFALAQIAIDTATAISGAVTQAQSVPYPANIVAIITGVTAVLANIAAAAAVIGGAPSIPSGAASSGGGVTDAADEVGGTEPNVRDLTGSTLLNQEPTKVFVVESDITNSQNNVKAIIAEATY